MARYIDLQCQQVEQNLAALFKKTKKNLQFDINHSLKKITSLVSNIQYNYHNNNTMNGGMEERTSINIG